MAGPGTGRGLGGVIDRAIGLISPRIASLRGQWRARMSAQYHDAAASSRRTKGWRAPTGDANAAARGNARLRHLARDFVRNNTIARRALSVLENNIVGDGIVPSVVCADETRKREIEALLAAHLDTTAVDAAGRLNLYGLQRLMARTMIEGGEVLARQRPRYSTDRLPLNFQVEVLEPEFIDDRFVGPLDGSGYEADGIRFDVLGRRTGYRLFRHHPGAQMQPFPESTVVHAGSVIHLFRLDRPGQRRGISWLAPAMSMLADAYDLADAQLVRQKIAALFVGFVHDAAGDFGQTAGPGSKEQPIAEELVPGMFEQLAPGRTVTFSSPPPAEGHAEFMKQVQRMIAAALDVTYEALSGDLEGVNFSSARLGRIEMARALTAVQWTLMLPQLCEPLGRWLREAIDMKLGRGPAYEIRWTPPRFPLTDPAREIPGMIAEVRAGFASRQQKVRELGFDPEVVRREVAEDMAADDAAGAVFDTDARHVSRAGVIQGARAGGRGGPEDRLDDAPDGARDDAGE